MRVSMGIESLALCIKIREIHNSATGGEWMYRMPRWLTTPFNDAYTTEISRCSPLPRPFQLSFLPICISAWRYDVPGTKAVNMGMSTVTTPGVPKNHDDF
jgi:hypothetical protein